MLEVGFGGLPSWPVSRMEPDAGCISVTADITLRYSCDTSLLPPALAARFSTLAYDDEARRFVAASLAAPHGKIRTALYHRLRRRLSDYDAYGLLRMYPLHLLSAAQLAALLAEVPSGRPRRLLDVGAGNGSITAIAAPSFETVLVTEASAVMRRRLGARGYRVLPIDLAFQALPVSERAHVVLCLNVIDRCVRPRTLLRHLGLALEPGGRLLLSVPLPLTPHVQRGGRTTDPDEPLPAAKTSWEASVASVAFDLLEPAGLTVLRLGRAPYLCHGDARCPLYALDTAIFVCAATNSARDR